MTIRMKLGTVSVIGLFAAGLVGLVALRCKGQ